MKRIAITLLILLILLALCGCSTGKVDAQIIAEEIINNQMFMIISEEWCGRVLVDKSTSVMYWGSRGSDNAGTLTLLVNPDGTPRIWEG